MASIADQVDIIISADAEQAKRELGELERSLDTLKTSYGDGGGGALIRATDRMSSSMPGAARAVDGLSASILGVGAAVAFLTNAMVQAVNDAEDERRGLVRLQSVLESTGRAHEVTAGQVDQMAQALEDYANIDKQAVMDATARLATYDNIASSLFERILNSAADLSAVFGTDISSAVSDLGRVMEDPIEGLTRLRRQGVMVTQEVEDQVTSLTEQNRLYEAQVLLLDEIDSKVGGVAEKLADTSPIDTLVTKWNKFLGEVGNTVSDEDSLFGSILGGFAWALDQVTGVMEDFNAADKVTSMTLDEVLSLETGDLIDYMGMLEDFINQYGSYDMSISASLRRIAGLVPDGAEAYARAYIDEGWLDAIQEEVDRRTALAQAGTEAQAQAEEDARRLKQLEEERLQRVEDETAATEELASLYTSTGEGRVRSLQEQLRLLEEMREADEQEYASLQAIGGDEEVMRLTGQRLGMYDAVIADLQAQLDELTIPALEPASIAEQVLGVSASDYVLDIPVSFDFEGRDAAGDLEAQLSSLKTAISSVYDRKPSDEMDLAGWQADMDILVGRYRELSAELDGIREAEAARAAQQEHMADLTETASQELSKLLSDEERAQASLVEYEGQLDELLEARLINQEEYNQLLERQKELLGMSGGEVSDWQQAMGIIGDEWDGFLKSAMNVDRLAGVLTDAFTAMGDALASGDGMDGVMDVFGDFAQQLTSELSTMFISAGLRCIIDMGWAGLGIGLALIAAGGVTGLAAGAMGSSSAALDDSILEAMRDELEAREKLSASINESIDTEYDLLRRQLDRNLISEEEFRDTASDLQQQRDVAEARSELSSSVLQRIEELNSEYRGMSGWDKFWSGRDEDIKDEIGDLRAYYDTIMAVSEDELRKLVETLKNMGVAVGNVPAFAEGGSFVTDGPQLIKVGDNPSGREVVRITPLDGMVQEDVAGPSTVIYITGDVYGIEDLYGKLQGVGLRLGRRMR